MANTFRTADAFEFVDAVRACNFDAAVAKSMAEDLHARMRGIEDSGRSVPSYLLAAYRGYEYVMCGPFDVVKIDDAKEDE